MCHTHSPVTTMNDALTLGADGVAVVAVVYRVFELVAEQEGVFADSGTYDMRWMRALAQQAVRNVPTFSLVVNTHIVVNSCSWGKNI